MRRIFLLMNVSLDGYFEGPGHDISGFKDNSEAFSLARESNDPNAEVDTLLFGHTTYEGMESFWPTPQAAQMMPDIARFMNDTPKVVVSKKGFTPNWDNVTVITDAVEGVRKLKQQPGKTIAIFGSSTLCISLMEAGLIDEFQIIVNPVVLGAGTPLFKGILQKTDLKLRESHQFKSGSVMMIYAPETA